MDRGCNPVREDSGISVNDQGTAAGNATASLTLFDKVRREIAMVHFEGLVNY